MLRLEDLKVRLATDDEGEIVARLTESAGFEPQGIEIDWSQIFPYWLVVEVAGELIGTIQVSLGKPMGRLEMLSIDPKFEGRDRALLVRELVNQGQATLRDLGAQVVFGVIPFENKSYKKVAKRRGYVVIAAGNVMIKSLKDVS